jgi:WD40-like Beta Propeller Repeat
VSRRIGMPTGVAYAAAVLVYASPAQATFPGVNGKLALESSSPSTAYDIHSINSDGSGDIALTTDPTYETDPAWSPDGTRIAFDRGSFQNHDIYVMDADGSNVTQLTNDAADDADPAWSPDGTRIVFETTRDGNRELYAMDADGSDPVRLTNDPATDRDPSWSPDGTKIVFASNRESYECTDPDNPFCYVRPTLRIFTMSPDGSATARLVTTYEPSGCRDGEDLFFPDWSPDGRSVVYELLETDYCQEGYSHAVLTVGSASTLVYYEFTEAAALGTSWSPDGREIAFVSSSGAGLEAAHPDGSGLRAITAHAWSPSWQPIPINAYPRPKGASPTYLSLVPAYTSCASPNTQHGAPLDSPSCTPPVRASSALTLGTPDANGLAAGSVGWAIFRPKADKPSTPADEADARLDLSVTDVRQASDLADYAGALEARPVIRITDRDNTPSPGGPGAATVTDVPFPYPVPCTPTATAPGSTCQTATSANAVAPGAVVGGRRTIWQLQGFEVRDADGGRFLTQGLFVP